MTGREKIILRYFSVTIFARNMIIDKPSEPHLERLFLDLGYAEVRQPYGPDGSGCREGLACVSKVPNRLQDQCEHQKNVDETRRFPRSHFSREGDGITDIRFKAKNTTNLRNKDTSEACL